MEIFKNHTYWLHMAGNAIVLCTSCAQQDGYIKTDRIENGEVADEECAMCGTTPTKQCKWVALHGGYDLR